MGRTASEDDFFPRAHTMPGVEYDILAEDGRFVKIEREPGFVGWVEKVYCATTTTTSISNILILYYPFWV